MSESERVGSVGEEAVRLLRALATEQRSAPQDPAPEDPGPEPTPGAGGTDAGEQHVCTTSWCPVCRTVGLLKENPELVEELTDSFLTFARSVREVLDHAVSRQEDRR